MKRINTRKKRKNVEKKRGGKIDERKKLKYTHPSVYCR